MGILQNIRDENRDKNIDVGSGEEIAIVQRLNRLFYLPKDIKQETEFVRSVMTRGFETQERVGLHASAITKESDNMFCYREHVLSLCYKQNQGENVPIDLKRVFEEGNAIHEKWQRLFIRGGLADYDQCDVSQYNEEYMISYTPDIRAFLPFWYEDEEIIVEIKSMRSSAYYNATRHKEGTRQLQWYLHLSGLKKGFILAENKDVQRFRVEIVEYDPKAVENYIDRAETIKEYYDRYIDSGMDDSCLPLRKHVRLSKKCSQCNMKDACYKTGIGRIEL